MLRFFRCNVMGQWSFEKVAWTRHGPDKASNALLRPTHTKTNETFRSTLQFGTRMHFRCTASHHPCPEHAYLWPTHCRFTIAAFHLLFCYFRSISGVGFRPFPVAACCCLRSRRHLHYQLTFKFIFQIFFFFYFVPPIVFVCLSAGRSFFFFFVSQLVRRLLFNCRFVHLKSGHGHEPLVQQYFWKSCN